MRRKPALSSFREGETTGVIIRDLKSFTNDLLNAVMQSVPRAVATGLPLIYENRD